GNLLDASLVIAHPAVFFAGYKTWIVQWAELAQHTNVPLFSIGNEMLAATKPEYIAYWEDIISSVREVYSGKLTYAAFSDVYYPSNNEVAQIQFWDKLDYVGVDVYPDFPTGTTTPTVAQLDTEWSSQGWMQYLADISTTTGKQIIFTETGCASFAGAANRSLYTDALIAQSGTQRDDATQAHWYQSFFNTWGGANTPDWLSGTFFWNNDPPQFPGLYDVTGYTIYSKLAGIIVASAYGGANYLEVNQNSFTGSGNDDRIVLYGDAGTANSADPAHDPTVTRSQTFSSTVTIYLNGTITNGVVPTVHFYINGADMGAQELSHTQSAWIDPTGLVSSDVVPFSFQVESLTVNQIKVAIDSPLLAGTQVYIDRVDINGTSLANSTVIYQPVSGGEVRYQLPHGSLSDGGYVLIDPTAYSNTLLDQPGTATNPVTVDGGGGVDTVYVLGTPDQYVIKSDSSGITSLSESSGLNQNAVLRNISAIEFADGSLLTDGHWNTAEGATALLIGNDIVLSFDEEVQKGAGTIAVYTGSALVSTVVESYDVAMSSGLAFSGSTLTINPSIELARGSHYFVTFTDDSVKDLAGNSYAGPSTYNFKTVCVVPLLHCLTGTSTFWKTGASLTDVTSTLASNPTVGIASESTTTALDGLYQHLDMPDGAYALTSAKLSGTAESNAVKANDALAALKIAVGMNPNADGSAVSPYQYLAADVNHDGQVKAADALNILKMAVKLSSAPDKEWLFVPESVGSESMSRTSVHWPDNPIPVTLGADQELDLIGIVKGDVNGSWVG
ncbi:MAG: Ig-like domain-containing protein, partial [Chlorobium sp.]|nr:Ig-like domain-containing protein [Chlorobium sp.]